MDPANLWIFPVGRVARQARFILRSRRFRHVAPLALPWLVLAAAVAQPQLLRATAAAFSPAGVDHASGPCWALKLLAMGWLGWNALWSVAAHYNHALAAVITRHRSLLMIAEAVGAVAAVLVGTTLYLTIRHPYSVAADIFFGVTWLAAAGALYGITWIARDRGTAERRVRAAAILELCTFTASLFLWRLIGIEHFSNHGEEFAVGILFGFVVASSVGLVVIAVVEPLADAHNTLSQQINERVL